MGHLVCRTLRLHEIAPILGRWHLLGWQVTAIALTEHEACVDGQDVAWDHDHTIVEASKVAQDRQERIDLALLDYLSVTQDDLNCSFRKIKIFGIDLVFQVLANCEEILRQGIRFNETNVVTLIGKLVDVHAYLDQVCQVEVFSESIESASRYVQLVEAYVH